MTSLQRAGVDATPLFVRGDTVDKIVKEDLRKNIAAMAVMTWALAEMPGQLGLL